MLQTPPGRARPQTRELPGDLPYSGWPRHGPGLELPPPALGSPLVTTDSVGYLAAFGGGLVSFLSPCVLPLVPGYLSIVTGVDVAELGNGGRRPLVRIALHTGLFVAGFSAVFVLLGLSATMVGGFALRNQVVLTRVSGVVVLAMALFLLGSLVLRAPWLYREARFHPRPVWPCRFSPPASPSAAWPVPSPGCGGTSRASRWLPPRC